MLQVWKNFLKEKGITNYNISAERYFEIWKSEVSDPDEFNERIRKEQTRLETELKQHDLYRNSSDTG